MEPRIEKRHALEKAKKLLASGNADELRYVALELRRCLEAVVYEKLWAYRDRVPIEVARKWQPPQAFRALLVMEPNAQHTSVLRFARQERKGVPASGLFQNLGTDLRFSPEWLTKTYNKLGSYLHASWPFARNTAESNLQKITDFLQKTIYELEPLVANTTTFLMAEVISFTCTECGTTIKANAAGIRKQHSVTCLNPDCECKFDAVPSGSSFDFSLDSFVATCPDCSADSRIPTQKVAAGYQFSCVGCGVQYQLTEPQWQFETLVGRSDPAAQ